MKDDNRSLLITTAIVFVVMLVYGYFSEGTHQDDDVTHFLIAKISWDYPASFFSIWGRPAFTIPYSLPAQFGFGSARVLTSILAALSCFVAGRTAKVDKNENFYLVPLFVALQPIYLALSFAFLTEVVFSFFLIVAIYFLKKEHYLLSSLAISFVPLSRHEGIVFLAIWALIFLKKRAVAPLVILALPMAIWNLGSYIFTDTLPAQIYFTPDQRSPIIKIEKTIFHYVLFFPAAVGLIIPFLFAVGFIKSCLKQPGMLHLVFIVYFSIHTLLYAYGRATSGGDLRLLAGVTPIVGIFALVGYNYFLEKKQRFQEVLFFFVISVTFVALVYGVQKFYKPWTQKIMSDIVAGETKWSYLSPEMSTVLLSLAFVIFLILILLKVYYADRNEAVKTVRTCLQVSLLTLIVIATCFFTVKPYGLTARARTMKEVAHWMKEATITDRNILFSNNSWLLYFLDSHYERRVFSCFEQYKKYQNNCLEQETVVKAPVGTILVWNRKYGDKGAMNYIENNDGFQLLKTFSTSTDGEPEVYIFEKKRDQTSS